MESIISALYHGELHLNENHVDEHPEEEILIESFQETVDWLTKRTDGDKAREWLNDLTDIHNKLMKLIAYDKFREGFIFGANLAMEACYGKHHLGN